MISRAAMIAIGTAGLALVAAGVAVAVTLGRGGASAAAVDDGVVAAPVLVAIADRVTTAPGGGATLAEPGKLGLRSGDVIVGFAGRRVATAAELVAAIVAVAVDGETTTVYAEVTRAGEPTIVRRVVDGDLQAAWRDAHPRPAAVAAAPPAPDPFAVPDPTAAAAPDPADRVRDEVLAGITQIDDTHWRITAAAADKARAEPLALVRGARVVPAMKNGAPAGMKLYAIRPGSVWAALGFVNGDTVERVNGLDVSAADKVLDAYQKLSSATAFTIELQRRGKPVTQHYTIR